LCRSEVKEIRDEIRDALGVAILGGSDERARWLQWGEVQEEAKETTPRNMGNRAHWGRWE
jgi:hypothetical protein